MASLYVGLFHFPMRNREGEIVATSTTSMDIHDIARSARTYGVARYFVVTPLPSQQEISWRIRGFWTEAERIAEKSGRGEALEYVVIAEDLEETLDWIERAEEQKPLLVATSARASDTPRMSYGNLRERIRTGTQPVYILFGTGWGMADELIDACDAMLPPIRAGAAFNHLSVRAAVAITLDRIVGEDT
jgi:hypothetical protein